jgi:hypothetical protein
MDFGFQCFGISVILIHKALISPVMLHACIWNWVCHTEGSTHAAVHSKELWRWCITLRINGFLDFVYRPEFQILENTTLRKLGLFPSSEEDTTGPVTEVALFMGPNRVGVSLPSPEDENRSSFRNVVFSTYLKFLAMGKAQKPCNPDMLRYLRTECWGMYMDPRQWSNVEKRRTFHVPLIPLGTLWIFLQNLQWIYLLYILPEFRTIQLHATTQTGLTFRKYLQKHLILGQEPLINIHLYTRSLITTQ